MEITNIFAHGEKRKKNKATECISICYNIVIK